MFIAVLILFGLSTFTICAIEKYDIQEINAALTNILTYDFANAGNGQYHFSFATSDGTERREKGSLYNPGTDKEAFVVVGSYSYVGPDRINYTVNYVADKDGFHPKGDHINLPWVKGKRKLHESDEFDIKSSTDKLTRQLEKPGMPNSSNESVVWQEATLELTLTEKPLLFSIINKKFMKPNTSTIESRRKKDDFTNLSIANSVLDIFSLENKTNSFRIEDINALIENTFQPNSNL